MRDQRYGQVGLSAGRDVQDAPAAHFPTESAMLTKEQGCAWVLGVLSDEDSPGRWFVGSATVSSGGLWRV